MPPPTPPPAQLPAHASWKSPLAKSLAAEEFSRLGSENSHGRCHRVERRNTARDHPRRLPGPRNQVELARSPYTVGIVNRLWLERITMFLGMPAASAIVAISRIRPAPRGQRSTSRSKARRMSAAHIQDR